MLEQALNDIRSADTPQALQDLKVKYLGKKGLVTQQLKSLGSLSPEERKEKGQQINKLKAELAGAIEKRKTELAKEKLNRELANEKVDVTLPGVKLPVGSLHLLTKVINRLCDVFVSMGYDVVTGPELETEHYNFDALNFPKHHPARDLQDTFWTTDGRLLRTHTSPMQARYMEEHTPPFKIVVPGKVFREEAVDATHEAMFHQLEALVVGERITMADLKGAINEMATALFGKDTKTKLQQVTFPL